MAVTFVGKTEATDPGSANAVTIGPPPGVQADDQLLAFVADSSFAESPLATPDGWTLIAGPLRPTGLDVVGRLYRRTATGSEPPSWTWDTLGQENPSAVIVAYRGVDPSAPIGAVDERAINTASVSHPSATITPVAADSMIVMFAVFDTSGAQSWAPPAGMTERADYRGATDVIMGIFDVIQPAIAPVSATATIEIFADTGVNFIVALTPLTEAAASAERRRIIVPGYLFPQSVIRLSRRRR